MTRHDYLRCLFGTLVSAKIGISCSSSEGASRFSRRMRELEHESKGRLGVAVFDSNNATRMNWRGNERFPMCSTFKFLLTATILGQVDRGNLEMSRHVAVPAKGLITHSPITEKFAGKTMSVSELCQSTMIWSDNTAANLLLALVCGPSGVTKFVRELGDSLTRLDRYEPELNSSIPGDPRDTTTPLAMLQCMSSLLLEKALKPESKTQLTTWLLDNRTGDQRLRAGLPAGARVGDKTGTVEQTSNDIAIIWPPGKKPVLVTCYLTESLLTVSARDKIHAAVASEIASTIF